MSNRLLNLVWGVERFGPPRSGPLWRLVMATLADRVAGDDADSCYPGLQDIADRTELGASTVKRVLAGLKAEGWLASMQRPGYGTVYRLNVARLQGSQRRSRRLQRSTRLRREDDRDVEAGGNADSRSPAGMTERKANATATTNANSRSPAGMTTRTATATATTTATALDSLFIAGPSGAGSSVAGPSTTLSWPLNALLNRKNPENHLKPFAAASSGRGEVSSRERKGVGPGHDAKSDVRPDPKPDPRHVPCRELILAMQQRLGVSYPWTAAYAGQLGALLRSRPDLTVDQFNRWLRNLAASEDESARKRTAKWLPNLQEYSRGPLDRHRRLRQDFAGDNAPRRKSALEKYLEFA